MQPILVSYEAPFRSNLQKKKNYWSSGGRHDSLGQLFCLSVSFPLSHLTRSLSLSPSLSSPSRPLTPLHLHLALCLSPSPSPSSFSPCLLLKLLPCKICKIDLQASSNRSFKRLSFRLPPSLFSPLNPFLVSRELRYHIKKIIREAAFYRIYKYKRRLALTTLLQSV